MMLTNHVELCGFCDSQWIIPAQSQNTVANMPIATCRW